MPRSGPEAGWHRQRTERKPVWPEAGAEAGTEAGDEFTDTGRDQDAAVRHTSDKQPWQSFEQGGKDL